jgi:hypothetical protein
MRTNKVLLFKKKRWGLIFGISVVLLAGFIIHSSPTTVVAAPAAQLDAFRNCNQILEGMEPDGSGDQSSYYISGVEHTWCVRPSSRRTINAASTVEATLKVDTCPPGTTNPECGSQLPAPLPPKIPAANFSYTCQSAAGHTCIQPGDNPVEIITHVVFGEGGSISLQTAANVIQTVQNRAYLAWTCAARKCGSLTWTPINPGKIPWEQITAGQFRDLVLYIMSDAYMGTNGVAYPAYNAWSIPRNSKAIENGADSGFIESIRQSVEVWLVDGPGKLPISAPILIRDPWGRLWTPNLAIRNMNVMYYYATSNELSIDYAHRDVFQLGVFEPTLFQYYGTFPIHEWE